MTSDRGQAMVEFMLLFPFVLFLALFLIEFGFLFYSYVTVNNTASEAARWASVGKPTHGCGAGAVAGSVEDRAVSLSNGLVLCTASDSEISVGYRAFDGSSKSEYKRGDQVVVNVTHTYRTLTPVGELMKMVSFGAFPETFTLASCSDARLETRPDGGTVSYTGEDCGS